MASGVVGVESASITAGTSWAAVGSVVEPWSASARVPSVSDPVSDPSAGGSSVSGVSARLSEGSVSSVGVVVAGRAVRGTGRLAAGTGWRAMAVRGAVWPCREPAFCLGEAGISPRGRGTSARAARSRSKRASRRWGVTRALVLRGDGARAAWARGVAFTESRSGGAADTSVAVGDASVESPVDSSPSVIVAEASVSIVDASSTRPASSPVVGWAAMAVESGGGMTPGSSTARVSSTEMASGPPVGNSTTAGPGIHSRSTVVGSSRDGINPWLGASSSSAAIRIGRLAALIRSAIGRRPVAAVAGLD